MGLIGQTTDYKGIAEARGPRRSRVRLTQIVRHLQIPLFQFGVFYGRGVDLEIAPGPPMTFNGRVHANSNIYICNSSSHFDSFLTTAGNLYRYIKREPKIRGSNPEIKDASGNYQTLNFDHEFDQDFNNPWTAQDWMNVAMGASGGLARDRAMGVKEMIPLIPDLLYDPVNPEVVSHQMIEKATPLDSPQMQVAKLYYQADLRIVNTSGKGKDKNGQVVTLAPTWSSPRPFTTNGRKPTCSSSRWTSAPWWRAGKFRPTASCMRTMMGCRRGCAW